MPRLSRGARCVKRGPPPRATAYSGGPCQETPSLPPGCLGFRWCCDGKRDVPAPKLDGRPGVS
eukprot:5695517-Pyramimonas_sp.AAC.1